jgi:malate synthase
LSGSRLHHVGCSEVQAEEAVRRVARLVDPQSAADRACRAMLADFECNIAFAAVCELVFAGREQPNDFTDAILCGRRSQPKAALRSANHEQS